ncbi:MAG: hypothetical protein RMA76_11375 [Deltaproteobacteria bacterium]|jgi:hypothetical protein
MVERKPYAVIFLALSLVACEKCAPGRVGQGLARLTIRNVGAIASAINDDAVCGFESEAAKDSWVASAEPGQTGSVTWRVEGCELDFGTPEVSTDCNDVASEMSGHVKVTATRTIEGYITGDRGTPVVPAGPTAVTVHIERAEYDHFKVASSDSDASLTMITGSVAAIVKPRVAADRDRGVCSVATGDATLEAIQYAPSRVRIVTEDRDFEVEVNGSNLSAVNGRFEDRENELWGTINVWGSEEAIPTSDDEHALNPDYDRAKQIEAYACKPELAVPVRYDCQTDIRPIVAQGASQLTIQTLGMLAKLAEADESCGFSSADVKYNPIVQGNVGEPGGAATYTMPSCTMRFDAGTVIDTDCNGKNTYATGTIHVRGTKTVRGYVSGDPEDAIVPTTRDPAAVEITAAFEGFSVWTDPGENVLSVESGELSGRVLPRVAIDVVTGACSKQTPVTSFEEVRWSNAVVEVASGGLTFGVGLDTSNLEAQNGRKGDRENYLAGQMVVDGDVFDIPISDAPILDPGFDAAAFDSSYTCDADLRIPKDDSECDMQQALAEGAGRLVVQTVGALGTLINNDDDCGFEALRVKAFPDEVVGDDGEMGSMTWTIDGCRLNGRNGTQYDEDCKGRTKNYGGTADFNVTRTVSGLRDTEYFLFDSIIPKGNEPVDITMHAVALDRFVAYDLEPGAMESSRAMFIESATVRAHVKPILAERASEPGYFGTQTNIAHMTDVELSSTPATIFFDGKQFDVQIDYVRIEAFNGSYVGTGQTNFIRGVVSINGQEFAYAEPAPLDPDFEQADFTERYQCKDVAEPIPPAP